MDPVKEIDMAYDDEPSEDWGAHEPAQGSEDGDALDRPDIVLRAVYTLLFALVISVLETLLGVVVVFQLVYSLVTRQLPSERVQGFANGITAYFYQILRYLTHNDSVLPFPFSDFPAPLQPTWPAYAPPVDPDDEAGGTPGSA